MVSKENMTIFDDYMRFWVNFLQMMMALADTLVINVCLGIIKRMSNYAKAFMLTVIFPSFSVAAYPRRPLQRFNASNGNDSTSFMGNHLHWHDCFRHRRKWIRALPFSKSQWWYIAIGSGAAITGGAI